MYPYVSSGRQRVEASLSVSVKLRYASCNHHPNVHRDVDVYGALSRVFIHLFAFLPDQITVVSN